VSLGCLEARPECAFVYGHYKHITVDGAPFPGPPQDVIGDEHHYPALLNYNHIAMHATVMYRRGIFKSVGNFDTSLSACEDYDLYLRVARRFPVCSHKKVVAEYRHHSENMTRSPAVMLVASLSVLRSQWKYAKENKQYREAYEAGLRRRQDAYGFPLSYEVRMQIKERDWKQALKGMVVLLRYYPLGLTLLTKPRRERYRPTRRLRLNEYNLEVRERRLKELEVTQEEPEDALVQKRQEIQRLRRRIRRLEREVQSLTLWARIRQNGRVRDTLRRLGRVRSKVLKR
jgi:hypothetical protein